MKKYLKYYLIFTEKFKLDNTVRKVIRYFTQENYSHYSWEILRLHLFNETHDKFPNPYDFRYFYKRIYEYIKVHKIIYNKI